MRGMEKVEEGESNSFGYKLGKLVMQGVDRGDRMLGSSW